MDMKEFQNKRNKLKNKLRKRNQTLLKPKNKLKVKHKSQQFKKLKLIPHLQLKQKQIQFNSINQQQLILNQMLIP